MVTALTALLLAVPFEVHRAFEPAPGPRQEQPAPGAASLQAWLAAVDRHRPGELDAAAIEIASWTEAQLKAVAEDLGQLSKFLIRAHIRFARSGEHSFTNYAERKLSMDGVQQLLRLTDDEARRGDISAIARCAALLHTDIATLIDDTQDHVVRSTAATTHRTVLRVQDGRQEGLADGGPHWELSRTLLAFLPRDVPQDDSERRWYVAAAAYMHSRGLLADLVPHMEQALRLFPNDAPLLFYAGSMHETMTGPMVQRAVSDGPLPGGFKARLQNAAAHLQEARALFRRAVDSDPDFVEARIRLGRVLGVMRRHEEAAAELQQAVRVPAAPLLQYYGWLFLGEEQAALGRRDAARESVQRAGSLYPMAQSPRLALSRLARSEGSRTAAVTELMTVLTVPVADPGRQDPWWIYYLARRDETDPLLAQWRASVPRAGHR